MLDFEALSTEARALGGEISFRKLLRNIAGKRAIVRATCYIEAHTPPFARTALTASGFSVLVKDEQVATTMATDALALIEQVDALVLCPASPFESELLLRLAEHGPCVEAASFDGTAPTGTSARILGKECMFTP
ncbi:MAG: NYN domain-containing protein [Planctomycetota bacterium]|nr:NYN domain-containing protein [Planctomycetota bacterium]